MKKRYIVKAESETGHCCFTHSIIDTKDFNNNLCECFDEKTANMICNLLNEKEEQ